MTTINSIDNDIGIFFILFSDLEKGGEIFFSEENDLARSASNDRRAELPGRNTATQPSFITICSLKSIKINDNYPIVPSSKMRFTFSCFQIYGVGNDVFQFHRSVWFYKSYK